MKTPRRIGKYFGVMTLLVALFFVPKQSATAQAQVPSEDQIKMHYSLYFEDFRNQNFERSLPNLHWILEHAPGFPNDNDRNFRRLIEAYEGLAETEPAYLDSALVTFDEAVPALRAANIEVDEVRWLINKGRFIQTHGTHFDNAQSMAAEAYLEAYEKVGGEIDPYYVMYLISDFNQRGDRDATIAFMERAESTHGDEAEVVDFIDQVRDTLFRNPADRIAWLESRLERNPEDVDLISDLFDLYLREGERQKAAQLSERLLDARPTARSFEMIARMRLEDAEPQAAFELYERALQMDDVEGRERDIYFNMGIAQQQMGRLSTARQYFRRALDIDSSFGAAIIAIGDLYVTQVGNCGFDRDDRAVYWLAVDYYERAASVDPSVAQQARQKAATYRRSFPTAEDRHFRQWSVGDTYNVNSGCYSWINESTRVR
jgi:tetratricopeptide (TPR) repeat protein